VPNYPVTTSARDETTGYGANTNGVALVSLFDNLNTRDSYGEATIDTSAIGTDVISAATFYWYHDGYTKTKAASYQRLIYLGGTLIFNDTGTPAAAGWHSHELTSGELALINKTGDTGVLFDVGNPGGTYFRNWQVAAWDYGGAGARACYLAVTHAPAGGPTKFSILR
jgi:hypothetical protein